MSEQPSGCADLSISIAAPYGTLQSKSVTAADLNVNEHSKGIIDLTASALKYVLISMNISRNETKSTNASTSNKSNEESIKWCSL